jgi:hypothetical protein
VHARCLLAPTGAAAAGGGGPCGLLAALLSRRWLCGRGEISQCVQGTASEVSSSFKALVHPLKAPLLGVGVNLSDRTKTLRLWDSHRRSSCGAILDRLDFAQNTGRLLQNATRG